MASKVSGIYRLPTEALPSVLGLPTSRTSGDRRKRAYEEIKGSLLSGRYAPGDKLTVEEFASALAVSRQPVMEAMRLLAQEGLVEIVPQVGCRVATHSTSDIGDFFHLFASVEGLAAGLAAERRSAEELKQLRMVSRDLSALREQHLRKRERSESYRVLNRVFHGLIHSMARAPMISELARSLWDRSDFHLSSTSGHTLFAERFDTAHQEHAGILISIERRDPISCRERMTEHILGIRTRLLGASA